MPKPKPRKRDADASRGRILQVATEMFSRKGYAASGVDELATRCGLTADSLSVMLLHLELEGQVASLPGGRYQRLPEHPVCAKQ